MLGWQSASGGNTNTSNAKNRYYALNKLLIIEQNKRKFNYMAAHLTQ